MITNPKELKWDQPTEREDGTALDLAELKANNVYVGPVGMEQYTQVFAATLQDADKTPQYIVPFSLMDIAEGQYDLVVTALDIQGRESDYSAPIQIEVKIFAPKPPTGLVVS